MMSINTQHPATGRIGRCVSYLGGNNPTVFSIVIVAAFLLVVARILAPFEVGKDQASQLEAGQRLVAGLGLTTTNDVSPTSNDIADVPPAKYLTWWPPGFSIILAGFLYTGLPLLASLKIIYGLTTLVGWLGWGTLISRLVSEGLKVGKRTYPVHLLAIFIPILFTPQWSGTDVFLWAGIPIILLLLIKSSIVKSTRASLAFVGIAGGIFGSLYSIRYSSVFVGVAAGLMLLQISLPDLKQSAKRCAVFGLTAACLMVPVFLYAKAYSQDSSGLPAYVIKGYTADMLFDSVRAFLFHLPYVANLIFGVPIVDQIVYQMRSRWLNYVFGLLCLAVIVSLPFILWRVRVKARYRLAGDVALSLSLLPITLVASITMANVFFLGVRRYYEPIALCGVLIAYEIASKRIVHRWLKRASYVVLLTFAAYTYVYMPALAFSPARRGFLVNSVLGFIPPRNAHYRSTSRDLGYPAHDQMFSQKESSRLKLVDLHAANPQALFFVEEYGFFNYDRFQQGGPQLGRDVRVYPRPGFWRQAYTSKPVKVFWVVNEKTHLDFIPQANLKLVYSDPYERTRILESDFPESYKFFGSELAKPLQQSAQQSEERRSQDGTQARESKPPRAGL